MSIPNNQDLRNINILRKHFQVSDEKDYKKALYGPN